MTDISLKTLLETNAHFGHQVRRWNPRMAEYLYGEDQGIHIFDLTKTKLALEEALVVLKKVHDEKKPILFVGTKKQVKDKLKEVALELGHPFVNERFLGGTVTNFEQIKISISKLSKMKLDLASGEYNKFTKKERLLLKREIDRLERFFGGMKDVNVLPEIMFIVDIHKEIGAIREAKKRKMTIVGISDSNSDPNLVDYPIPMNDDSSKALDYVLDLVRSTLLGTPAKAVKAVADKTVKVAKKSKAKEEKTEVKEVKKKVVTKKK